MQIIRKNFGLKLLALALAIVGWAYFRFATNPIVAAARFNQQLAVPIVPANLPVGDVAHFTEREAIVTIQPKPGESPVKPDEVKAVLDLSNKGVGVYNVPVTLVAPDVAVQSLSPASVTLSIERIEQRAFPVDVHYGAQPNGVVVGSSLLRPPSVIVQGPTSTLAQVTAVRVAITLPTQPGTFDAMVRPVPVDSRGEELGNLVVSPNLVRVTMQFVAGTPVKK
ncbi:MAG TPA: hypothetical protein VMF61_17395 [Candidatus Acidoferrales bacterium]|nr:hypothetical protein [Candidatus Acidoferrales bacterium]